MFFLETFVRNFDKQGALGYFDDDFYQEYDSPLFDNQIQ